MTDALTHIQQSVTALRAGLAGQPAPRWMVLSRFGIDYLVEPAPAERPVEVLLGGGGGRLLARRLSLGPVPVVAVESECEAADRPLLEALPVLAAGQLGLRGVLLLHAACGLPGFARAPAIATIVDWIRAGDEDPLRGLDAARLGARFPEMRGLRNDGALRIAAELIAERGELAPAVAVARRGPSGATDAELEAWRRAGGDLLVDGCAAEVVAARHQGLECVALALVLDRVDAAEAADPGALAESAAALQPRLVRLLPELLRRLDGRAAAGREKAAT